MNLESLLEKRHEARVEWVEPWKACGPEGNSLSAHVTISCTVHDAVNLQRSVAKQAGRPTMGQDIQHLADFMAIHWAKPVEPERTRYVEAQNDKPSIAPVVAVAATILVLLACNVYLWRNNVDLRMGVPHGYKLEHFGYTSLGSDFRSVADGWTSNVGSKASAIRQAWRRWKPESKEEWREER